MVNKKEIQFNDKGYMLKCSIATAEYFERLFDIKFGKTLSDIIKIQTIMAEGGEGIETMLDNVIEMETNIVKMAYCMIIEAKKDNYNADFNMTYDEFASTISSLDPDTFKGVLAVATGLFPRKIQKDN